MITLGPPGLSTMLSRLEILNIITSAKSLLPCKYGKVLFAIFTGSESWDKISLGEGIILSATSGKLSSFTFLSFAYVPGTLPSTY